MKILLTGGYDTSNLGDHAMLHVLKSSLEQYEKVDITVLVRHLEKNIESDYNVTLIKNLDHDTKQESLGRFFNGFNLNDDTSHIQEISKQLQSTDCLIIGGGRLFIDVCLEFMRGPLSYFVLLVIIAKFFNVPIIIYAITIIEPKTDLAKEMLKFIIENANLVMIREESSNIALKKLNIKNNNLKIIPDPAFQLPKTNHTNLINNIFLNESLDINQSYIGINLRYTNVSDIQTNDAYYQKLSNFCDLVYKKYKTDILLISQMNYSTDNLFDDDRNLYNLIRNKAANKSHIFIVQQKYNVIETLAIYNKMKMLFSMRRHGLIFAATQNTPVYGLVAENNTKYALEEMGLGNNFIDFKSNFTIRSFDNLLAIEKIKEILLRNIPILAQKTNEYANQIFNLYRKVK